MDTRLFLYNQIQDLETIIDEKACEIHKRNKPWTIYINETYLSIIPKDILNIIYRMYTPKLWYNAKYLCSYPCLYCGSTSIHTEDIHEYYIMAKKYSDIFCYICKMFCIVEWLGQDSFYYLQPVFINKINSVNIGLNMDLYETIMPINRVFFHIPYATRKFRFNITSNYDYGTMYELELANNEIIYIQEKMN